MKCPDLCPTSAKMSAPDNNNDIHLYQEALKCLEIIANTGFDKTSLLTTLYDRCTSLIDTLHQKKNNNPYITSSLESLMATLSLQQSLLRTPVESRLTNYHTENKENDSTAANSKSSDFMNSRLSALNDMKLSRSDVASNTMESVIGLEEVKQVLKEAFIMPRQYPHLFTGGAKPWQRLLLYGPPGTGKTKLAMALASQLDSAFYCVSMSNLLSAWTGESEKILSTLFNEARQQDEKAVIFFDEIDCVCRTRSSTEDEHTRRLKTELLRQIEGTGSGDDKIFILATTNCPWDLDSAFLRRFQQRVFIPLPDRESRRKIIEQYFENFLPLTDEEWKLIIDLTDGYSGADITHLAQKVAFLPIRDMQSSKFWKFTSNSMVIPCSSDTLGAMQCTLDKLPSNKVMPRPIHLQDFVSAASTAKSTVSPSLIEKYKLFQ